jgi:succinate-semialdehyde dehydrogenase / glutarate-semialdehyde dehydrogenase
MGLLNMVIGTPRQAETETEEVISVRNPVTGELIGQIPQTSYTHIVEVVRRARVAQVAWNARPVKERARIIQRWADLLWEKQEEAIRIIRRETGKTDTGAFAEVVVMEMTATYNAKRGPAMLKPQTRTPGFPMLQKARVHYKPHGVVGFITPWNYPMMLLMMDAVPALLAGNAIVAKPSEVCPFSAFFAFGLLHQAGVPEDVAQIVTGDGAAGEGLIDHVDYVCFTGSTAVGRKVAQQAAGRLIPYSLELGGKDAMVVLADARLDIAAAFVFIGGCENAGQACASVERVYVEGSIYDTFIEKVREHGVNLKIGTGDGFDVHVGSMTNERELLRTEAHIRDAVEKGAEVIFGGKRRPDLGPLFFEPTVLVNVDHSMLLMQEETFGPLIPIMRVKDADEAIRMANDTSYGLSGSIFTRDLQRGEKLAVQINSGDIVINRVNAVFGAPHLPMGGLKDSGIGRRGGPEGLLRFVTTQSILMDRQIGMKPSLSLIDPLTYKVLRTLRNIRRRLPLV